MKAQASASLNVAEAALAEPRRVALIHAGREVTFGELAERVQAIRRGLSGLALDAAALVAVHMESSVEAFELVHALLAERIPFVPIHPKLTLTERELLVADAAPAALFETGDAQHLRVASREAHDRAPRSTGSLAAVLYTSGTSGRPKGAMLSRAALVASAAASAANLGWRDDDRWLLCLPICHVGGLSVLLRCLLARRPVVLEARFDPLQVLDSIVRERATLLSVVPTMLAALLAEDAANVLSRLRAVLVGGAALSAELREECARRGVPALATYGLTEACSQVTSQSPRDPTSIEPGSGRVLSGVGLRIVDGEENEAKPAVVGRIQLRGHTLMSGYLGRKELDGGWFDTGDLGCLDDAGRLHVHARRTDLIVTGGENVYPAEIEQAIEACRGVRRAIVFGVPDERWGQVVAVAVEPGPEPVNEAALHAAVCSRLATFKRPRRVCFVRSIPMRANGKVDRAGAIEQLTARLRPWSI